MNLCSALGCSFRILDPLLVNLDARLAAKNGQIPYLKLFEGVLEQVLAASLLQFGMLPVLIQTSFTKGYFLGSKSG